MTPTQGRVVKYFDSVGEHVAIITRVWSPNCVNLSVIRDGAHSFDCRTSVLQGSEMNEFGTWNWPKIEG
jgi:hypothetical protein